MRNRTKGTCCTPQPHTSDTPEAEVCSHPSLYDEKFRFELAQAKDKKKGTRRAAEPTQSARRGLAWSCGVAKPRSRVAYGGSGLVWLLSGPCSTSSAGRSCGVSVVFRKR